MMKLNLGDPTGGSEKRLEHNSAQFIVTVNNWKLFSQSQRWNPPTDVFETEDQVIIRIEIAGMVEEDFEITFDKNVLTVTGSRSDTFRASKVFHQMELNFGEFFSGIEINIPLDINHSEAIYENGYLMIFINKAVPKTIKIGK